MTVRRPVCVALLAATSVIQGCPAHHALPSALPPTAPREARVRMYNTYRPLTVTNTLGSLPFAGGYGMGMPMTMTTFGGLTLASGTTVFWPEDLAPLVAADSPTAHAGRAYSQAYVTSDYLLWPGLAGFFGGIGLVVLGVFVNGTTARPSVAVMATGAGISLTGIGMTIAGGVVRGASAGARETAFRSYNTDLLRTLGLCADGSPSGDCAPSAGGDAAPSNPSVNVTIGTPVVVPLGAR